LQARVFSDLLLRSSPIKVVAAVGGAIDQLSGLQSNSPRWLGKMGLEWLWRFASQPKRLFFRYWVEPFLLAGVLVWAKTKRVLERKARK
jgi:exopolysaccharide biosynthesis WecB/TagA/CpsF family protein